MKAHWLTSFPLWGASVWNHSLNLFRGLSECEWPETGWLGKGHLGILTATSRGGDLSFFLSTSILAPSPSHEEETANLIHQILGHRFIHIC